MLVPIATTFITTLLSLVRNACIHTYIHTYIHSIGVTKTVGCETSHKYPKFLQCKILQKFQEAILQVAEKYNSSFNVPCVFRIYERYVRTMTEASTLEVSVMGHVVYRLNRYAGSSDILHGGEYILCQFKYLRTGPNQKLRKSKKTLKWKQLLL